MPSPKPFAPAAQPHKHQADLLRRGDGFIAMLYTYRSCSKAVPRVKASDDPNKAVIYEKTYEILEPEVNKLKALMAFATEAVAVFKAQLEAMISGLSHKKVFSETFVLHMVRMLDMFAKIDALKDMKACLNNDFSCYKR